MTNANVRPEPQLRSCYDHIFFSGMGSARSCRGAGGIRTDFCLRGTLPIPTIQRGHMSIAEPFSLRVVIHGTAYSCWILTPTAQTSKVAAHQVRSGPT
jgi:hypothetical protein